MTPRALFASEVHLIQNTIQMTTKLNSDHSLAKLASFSSYTHTHRGIFFLSNDRSKYGKLEVTVEYISEKM